MVEPSKEVALVFDKAVSDAKNYSTNISHWSI